MTADILEPGRTCWRKERATRLAVLVDAAPYFRTLREAMLRAREAIYLIGWDFDLRIEMLPGEGDDDGMAPDGHPNRLGDFIRALVDERDVDLHILKWDGAMLAALGSQVLPTIWMEFFAGSNIHFALDSHHPVGACHHQKIVVIDDDMAFCGGIDVTTDRWDTPEHAPDDPRRHRPDGEPFGPWHDATTAVEGPVAAALGDLARERWERATGDELEPPRAAGGTVWPDDLDAHMRDVTVAIARTRPRYHEEPLVNEIEQLYIAAIEAAQHSIYLESQYLAAGTICAALEERLGESDPPEIVVVNPRNAESFMEDEAMHSVRARMIERLEDADHANRFRVLYPANAAGEPIYVHAKVLIVDGAILRVGSSNVDNRSLGFDTECDVALVANTDGEREAVRALRDRLMAEHMGCEPEDVREAGAGGSILAALDRLNGRAERRLEPIEAEPLDPLERALADTRLFDPRYRPKPKERVKHAVKRGIAPYHVEAVAGLGALVAVTAAGLAAWGGYRLVRRAIDGPRRERRLAAPAIVTDGRVRPAPRRDA